MKLWDWILAVDRFLSRWVNGKVPFTKAGRVVMPLPTTEKCQLQVNDVVRTERGLNLRILSLIGSGGQGEVYRAQSVDDGRCYALKVLYRSKATQQAAARIRRLVELRLDRLDLRICAPFDTIASNDLLGHVSALAEGVTLLEALEAGSLEFGESFEVAKQLAEIVARLESNSVVHGDLQASNIRILNHRSGIQVCLIDLDNFSAPDTPRPEMIGMTLYMAPELRGRFLSSKRVYPTVQSDRYALGVVFHETLLSFHPASGFDETPEEIDAAMLEDWKYDPNRANGLRNPYGYPVTSLSKPIIDLLRRALSRSLAERPGLHEWQKALSHASRQQGTCAVCDVPFVIERDRRTCPLGHALKLQPVKQAMGVARIPLPSYVSILGRNELGGDRHISRQHLIVRRLSDKLLIDVIGKNPVGLMRNGRWCLVPVGGRSETELDALFRIGSEEFAFELRS